ncbi:MAG: extracellular solute-binding protein, partial [Chloroflexi bacterium]
MRKFKLTALLLILILLLAALAACGGAAEQPAAPAEQPAAEKPAEQPAKEEAPAQEETKEEAPAQEEAAAGDKIEIEFWHAMGGNLGELVDELVARYNASQDKVVVKATFQGSYDDTYNALLAAFDAGTEPNITQNFDLASQTMIDTGRLIPAYQLMAADNYDPNTFLPAVRDYYSNENGMIGMAFNSSTPLLYYNADMFEAAGVEPPSGSLTFSEFKLMCEELMAADVAPFCFTYGQVGWYFEQILAN